MSVARGDAVALARALVRVDSRNPSLAPGAPGERECAREILKLLMRTEASDVAEFGEGRIVLLGLPVNPDAPVAQKTLAEIGRDVASILDVEELLTRIAQLTKRLIEYRTFGLFLLNDESELEIKVAVKYGESVHIPRIGLGEGLVGYAALHREPVRRTARPAGERPDRPAGECRRALPLPARPGRGPEHPARPRPRQPPCAQPRSRRPQA